MDKYCKTCQTTKSLEAFAQRKCPRKTGPDKVIPLAQCKDCTKQMHASWRTVNKESRKKSAITYMYGIPFSQYEQMVQEQQGRCKICQEPHKLFIDHDHLTGRVRGLICHLCNAGLGMFRDKPLYLQKAITYLQQP